MRRISIGIAAMVLVATACTAGTSNTPVSVVNPSASHAPVTLNVWGFYTERELAQFNDVIKGFEVKYPWITINMVPGKQFGDIVRGINAGTPIDVAIDIGPDNVGKLCASGGWQDLAPYMTADNVNFDSIFPASVKTYTSYQGKQCALPMLTDAYGLYYNKTLLAKAGFKSPPKTLSELTTMAEKLTVRNPDGSIKVMGFDPSAGFYESANIYLGQATGAHWYDSSGKSAFGTDPAWQTLLDWDKKLIDFYGYDNVVKFLSSVGGADSEWNSQQAFENGEVAMAFDGEWRTEFITNDKSTVNYATAPFPVADDHPELYGSGLIGGTVVGLPKTAQNPSEAWLFIKEITTNTQFLTQLANTLANVPTTFDSLKDPTLTGNPNFKTFMDIAANPNSSFRALTTLGTADVNLQTAFVEKWEAGNVPDLQSGLSDLASQIDREMQLG